MTHFSPNLLFLKECDMDIPGILSILRYLFPRPVNLLNK